MGISGSEVARDTLAPSTAFFPVRFRTKAEAAETVATIQALIDSPLGAAFRNGHLEAWIYSSPIEWEPLLYFSKGAQAAARLAGVRLPQPESAIRVSGEERSPSLLTLSGPHEEVEGSGSDQASTALRILIIEDHLDTATMLANMLEGWGFRAAIARSGAEARRVAAEYKPRVVLLDLGLPDQHGYRVARDLRESADWGNVSFIVVTGWAAPVDQSLSLNAGISHHLVKPVNPEALHRILDNYRQESGH